MTDSKPAVYGNPENYLSQGDLFSLDVVTPFVDTKKRIFRSSSGRPAKTIPVTREKGVIFEYDRLIQKIQLLPDAERVYPFDPILMDGSEWVVVEASITKYFIVASQTCDISGEDRQRKFACVIAPVRTLAQYFLETLGFSHGGNFHTVRPIQYLEERLKQDPELCNVTDIKDRNLRQEVFDDFGFIDYMRRILGIWNPKKGSEEKAFRGALKQWLDEIGQNRRYYYYYLPKNAERQSDAIRVPESFVDFTQLYSIRTSDLLEKKDMRCGTLNSPYKEEFAQKLSHYYERVAVKQIKGESF